MRNEGTADGGVDIVGVVYLTGLPAVLDADRCDALRILATQAAVAIENFRLHERALERASEDSLTGGCATIGRSRCAWMRKPRERTAPGVPWPC